jgi:hypothetical protein
MPLGTFSPAPTMKLPKSKQKELKEKGKPDSPPLPYGGAMGRLRDFEQQRGIEDTDLSNPAVEKRKRPAKTSRKPKK